MENEHLYKQLLENAGAAIVLISLDGDVLYLNSAAASMSSMTTDEMTGKNLFDLFSHDFASSRLESIKKVAESGESIKFDDLKINLPGGEFWMSSRGTCLKDADGSIKAVQMTMHDVTDRKNAELKLTKSERLFRELFNQSSDYVMLFRPVKGGAMIADLSDSACVIHGYTRDELIGRHVGILNTEESKSMIPERVKRIMSGETLNFISEHVRKDGSKFNVEVVSKLVKLNEDESYILSIERDITEKLEAENMLKESEERYRELVEGTDDLVTQVDGGGRFTFVNSRSVDYFGISPEECMGRPAFDFVYEDDREDTRRRFDHFIKRKEEKGKFENRQVSLNGEVKNVIWNSNFHYDRIGNVLFINGIGRDITQRKKYEEQEKQNLLRLQTLLELERMESATLNDISDFVLGSAVEITGSEIGYLGFVDEKSPVMNVHAWSKLKMEECSIAIEQMEFQLNEATLWDEVLHKGKPVIHNDYHGENPFNSGSPKWFVHFNRLLTVPFYSGGKLSIILSVGNKPSDYYNGDAIQLQLLLGGLHNHIKKKVVNKKLKDSLNEKEILLKEIHHRVKNNIGMITSLINLQSMSCGNEDVIDHLRLISNRIKSIAYVHEKLYRSEDLKHIEYKEYIDSILEDIVRSFLGGGSNITFTTDIDNIYIDFERAIPCSLMINEIVTNSIKHAFPDNRKGIVNINFKVNDSNNFRLEISDDGIGLPENFKADNTESLGFQLLTGLAKQLHGELEITNKKGTQISISFPKELQA